MTYKESIIAAMTWLGEQPDTIFIGQTVLAGGSYLGTTLDQVPKSRRIEWPVAEEMQLGASLGLALSGDLCVVSIFPRIDFLLLAMNQLVNHIDKLPEMSEGKMKTRIIIRTSVGPKKPLDGGPQHTNDYAKEIASMCRHVHVVELGDWAPEAILATYQEAYRAADRPATLVVEDGNLY